MDISICILTYNGEEYLKEVLQALLKQKTGKKIEILLIDSGSTDNTLNIANKYLQKYSNIRLIKIPNREFGHAKTRNLAIRQAKGKIVVFLVQDATPHHDTWLEELTKHFKNPDVMAVYGRHVPRDNAPPFITRDTISHFNAISSYGDLYQKKTKSIKKGSTEWHRLIFFSDVNCALRRSYALKTPYPNVEYAEDQLMGKQIIEGGYIKVFSNDASVYHSHNYPLHEYFFRYIDEYKGLKETLGYIDELPLIKLLPYSIKTWMNEVRFVVSFEKKSFFFKLFWVFGSGVVVLSRRFAALVVKYEDHLRPNILNKLSLEKKKRK